MIMYPSILWLSMMSLSEEYVGSKLLHGFILKSQHATLICPKQSDNKDEVIAEGIPTWSELVGPASELVNGITFYVTNDCTPSTKQILPKCPSISPEVAQDRCNDGKNDSALSKAAVEEIVKQITEEIWLYHSCLPFNTEFYNMKRRVVTDHLLSLVKTEISAYHIVKNRRSEIHRFPFLWKMIGYFQCVFSMVGSYPQERYESLLSINDIFQTILLQKDDSGVTFYHAKTWKTLNHEIMEKVSKSGTLKKFDNWNHSNPTNKIDIQAIAEYLNNLDIDKTKEWPSDSFIATIEKLVFDRQRNTSIGLKQWPDDSQGRISAGNRSVPRGTIK